MRIGTARLERSATRPVWIEVAHAICLLLVCAAGCGGAVRASSAQPETDAGSDATSQGVADARSRRVPLRHRAAGGSCPLARGPTPGPGELCPMDGGFNLCAKDSDCTSGTDGRCIQSGPIACAARCSYDTCADDSSCANNEPCECRASESSGAANSCVSGGDCRVDADCGPGGYCSPSQVGVMCDCPSPALCGPGVHCEPGPCACGDACGHAYFCHTDRDACIDDADCGNETCNYDTLEKRWTCAACWPIP